MSFLTSFFTIDNYIYAAEVVTVLAILLLLGYIFFILNVFKKG